MSSNSSRAVTFTFGQIPLRKVWTFLFFLRWVKWYHYSSSTRRALALNNPQRLICYKIKESEPIRIFRSIYLSIYLQTYLSTKSASSNSSRAVTFIFQVIPLGKVWNTLSIYLSIYVSSNISNTIYNLLSNWIILWGQPPRWTLFLVLQKYLWNAN